MATGVTTKLWEIGDIVALLEAAWTHTFILRWAFSPSTKRGRGLYGIHLQVFRR